MELVLELIDSDNRCGPPTAHDRLGGHLWAVCNAARVWRSTNRKRRHRLFTARRQRAAFGLLEAEDSVPDELGAALTFFRRMWETPEQLSLPDLASACLAVGRWAEGDGKLNTALLFVELAASILPTDPVPANTAAKLARESGAVQRAEIWYRRAIGLARRAQNTIEYINSHLGLATLSIEACRYSEAMARLRTAGGTARTAGLREQAAEAFHDALYIATMQGDFGLATHYAHRANATYPKRAKRYPAFAYDVALLLTTAGMYRLALRLLRTVLRKIESPAEQLVVWGTLARSAAGCRESSDFNRAVDHVERLAPKYRNTAPAALYSVAEGARLLSEWSMAEEYAREALAAARANNLVQIVELASSLCSELLQRTPGRSEIVPDAAEARSLRNLTITVHQRLIRWQPRIEA